MKREIRSIIPWHLQQLSVMVLISIGLIVFTLLVDGKEPDDGIIMLYNKIFFFFPFVLALILPVSTMISVTYMNLKFGANRRDLYWAIEIVSGAFFVICLVIVMVMNAFSTEIYGVIEPEAWDITALEWGYVLIFCLLMWKTFQRASYIPNEAMTKRRWIGWGFIGGLYLIAFLVGMIFLRRDITIIPVIEEHVILIANVVILLSMSIMIVVLECTNYRLFMKVEV